MNIRCETFTVINNYLERVSHRFLIHFCLIFHISASSTSLNQWHEVLFRLSPFLGTKLGMIWSKTLIWSVYLNSMISGSSVLHTSFTLPLYSMSTMVQGGERWWWTLLKDIQFFEYRRDYIRGTSPQESERMFETMNSERRRRYPLAFPSFFPILLMSLLIRFCRNSFVSSPFR